MRKALTGGQVAAVFVLAAVLGCQSGGGHGRNHAPAINSRPGTEAFVAENYGYKVQASDADGDGLTFSLVNFPAGMTINSATGEISWVPTMPEVGNNLVEVRVSDGSAGVSQLFAVRVNPVDNGVPFQRGFTMVAWWDQAYLQPPAAQSLAQMRRDGVEWVSILATWYVDTTNSTTIYAWDGVTPTDESVIAAIDEAHALGFNVVLKPHIDPRTGEWRGDINFSNEADWATWFDNYNLFLGHYLDIAQAHNVQAVIIGTELKDTEGRETDWRNTVALARARYSGLLTYGANHNSFPNVTWWDAVDYIGISAYFPLTSSNSPSVSEIDAVWTGYIPILRAFAAYYDRDIVFTEIGYTSRDGTNITPWNYSLATPPDPQEQADCYRAALESLYAEPWFKGMYWWAWSYDPSTDNNGYDILNKPAETVLREWYAGN